MVCQVRHEPLGTAFEARQVVALQTTFGNGFTKLESQTAAELNFGPVGVMPPGMTRTRVARMSTVEGGSGRHT